MNLLLFEAGEPDHEGRVVLDDRRADHLRKVLRVEPGRTLRAGVIDRGQGEAVVEAVEGPKVRLRYTPSETSEEPTTTLDLIVAMPRPQALHRVVQNAASMRVNELILCNSWRVEKSFFDSPSATPEKIRRHLLLGAEQGRNHRLPKARTEKLLVPFVRSLGEPEEGETRLIAHPSGDVMPEDVLRERAFSTRIVVAIGPEGGWIDREVRTFGEAGFRCVSLGPWILKVETAVAATLAQLELLRRLDKDLEPSPRS